MPDPSPDLTLALILSAAGVVPAAALVTGIVQLLKQLGGTWSAQASRIGAFALSAVLVVLAYVTTSVEITVVTAFGAFLAWYAIARLALATYDDVTAQTNSLRGPTD